MIIIEKNNYPKELITYKQDQTASYENLRGEIKKAVTDSLLDEQGYLCAYCMKRIREYDIRIEHWLTQSNNINLALDYNNMFGVCQGKDTKKNKFNHCEKIRGDNNLTINPTNNTHITTIIYAKDGTISSSYKNIDNDLNSILNLNVQTLKENRSAIIKSIEKAIEIKFKKSKVSKQFIEKTLDLYKKKNSKKEFKEYCGVAIYFLEKKLKKL